MGRIREKRIAKYKILFGKNVGTVHICCVTMFANKKYSKILTILVFRSVTYIFVQLLNKFYYLTDAVANHQFAKFADYKKLKLKSPPV